MSKKTLAVIVLALACSRAAAVDAAAVPPATAEAEAAAEGPVKAGGIVTIVGARPTSLPTEIPTTMEGLTGEEIATRVNATDSEDALKYFPSLLVRKRYIGDYNHAVLSSRASGTGNSARSAVYADGILLSNFLGNGVNGLTFAPRWGLVTPEEIERVDVMYGPFSAAYPGNSVGAVVDYVTRMPTAFEAHARVAFQSQPFDLDRTHATYDARETSASVGDRAGALAWWIDAQRTDSESQPLTFATRLAKSGAPGGEGVPVTGAVPALNPTDQPWYLLGTQTQYHTRQDHLKIKLAYELTPTLRASYLYGLWRNATAGNSASWLRDADGRPVYGGPVVIDGLSFSGSQALSGGDFFATRERLQHDMHGLSLKSHAQGEWDGELAASLYRYQRDDKRQNAASNPLPDALAGGAGTLADGSGTGWDTLALRGTWRPSGVGGRHVVEAGLQQERYQLRYVTSTIAGDWLADGPGALASRVAGRTRLQSVYVQDAWQLSAAWKAVLGGREEHWSAYGGTTAFSATSATRFPSRTQNWFSPKAALSWQAAPATVLKASVGRAIRMPTVSELYGATSSTDSQFINDPDLAPEQSWTGELSAEHEFDRATGRLTLFGESTREALYSQTTFDADADKNITRVQNVGRIATLGVEAAFDAQDWPAEGLDLSGSVTWADSEIRQDAGFVGSPGDTIGKRQPNIPRWRATALASYRFDPRWTGTVAARYSGRQFRTLNNADVNGFAYQGASEYFTVDVRAVWRASRHWTASFGIDNANDDRYWNFHPYPQRLYSAELRYDL